MTGVIYAAELELSELRGHCRADHKLRAGEKTPRSNLDLAAWHAQRHHRYASGMSHIHRGTRVYVLRDKRSSVVGRLAWPLGDYTGQEMVTRAQLREQFLSGRRAAAMSASPFWRNEPRPLTDSERRRWAAVRGRPGAGQTPDAGGEFSGA